MITNNLTILVFWGILVLALTSMTLTTMLGDILLGAVLVSLLLSIWSIVRSERGGIVRRVEARRAFEPARQFNGIQILVLVVMIMAQLGFGLYRLLT